MKIRIFAVLLALCALLCACTSGGGDQDTTTTTTKNEQAQPSTTLSADAYVSLRDDKAAALDINGDQATLTVITETETKKFSGAFSYTDKKLTIGESSFDLIIDKSRIGVTVDGQLYTLDATTKTSSEMQGIYLLSNSWSCDGMSLTFNGMTCTLTVGDLTITNLCTASFGYFNMSSVKSNLALGSTVEASSLADGTVAESAVDGDFTTRWASERTDYQSITVDLGETAEISVIRLLWEVAAGSDYTLEVSTDGENWTVVQDVKGNTVAEEYLTYTFDTVEARYVKMNGATRTTQYGFSLWEFEIYDEFTPDVDTEYTINEEGKLVMTFDGQEYVLSAQN